MFKTLIYGGVLLGLHLFLPGYGFAHAFPDHSEPRVGSEIKTPQDDENSGNPQIVSSRLFNNS